MIKLQTKTVRQGISKAYLMEPVERFEFDNFKNVFSNLLKQILTAKKENSEADTCNLEAELDRLVYELYGLSEEEIGFVEGVCKEKK